MNKNFVKYVIVGVIILMVLPILLSIISISAKLVFKALGFAIVGFFAVKLYNIFLKKTVDNLFFKKKGL